jgi:hypothetical protein
MAYVLGFFAADGYMTVNRRGGQYWCIQIADRELLYKIRAAIKSNHSIGIRSPKRSQNTLYRLQIGSIEMCNDLRALGFSEKKTHNMVIPAVPHEYLPEFIRGYFDGDGHVWTGIFGKRKRPFQMMLTVFTSCSHIFLKQLQYRLQSYGVIGGSLYRKESYSRLQYAKRNSLKLYGIMYNTKAVNTLYLQRKKRVFERFLKMRT